MASLVGERSGWTTGLHPVERSPDPDYPGTGAVFECTQDCWDQPFDSNSELCRQICFESKTPGSLCSEFSLLGYMDGRVLIGIEFKRLQSNEYLRRYFTRRGCTSFKPDSGFYDITSEIKPLFDIIANNNTIPLEQLEKVRSIVEQGSCDPCPLLGSPSRRNYCAARLKYWGSLG